MSDTDAASVFTALALYLNILSDTDAACVSTTLALYLNILSDTDAACVSTVLALYLNMLSDTDAACVSTTSALYLNILSDTDAACVSTTLALYLNMLSDTDAACVSTALALCLKRRKKENESSEDQGVVQKKTVINTHTHTHTRRPYERLSLSELNYCNNFLRLGGPLFDEILKTVSVIILRRVLICEKQSLSTFIHYMRYLTTGFRGREILFVDIFTVRQAVTE